MTAGRGFDSHHLHHPLMIIEIDISPIARKLDEILVQQSHLKKLVEKMALDQTRQTHFERHFNGPVFLRLKDVERKTGISRSSIYLKINEGTFPDRHNLGDRAVRWLESDIDDWINSRIQT